MNLLLATDETTLTLEDALFLNLRISEKAKNIYEKNKDKIKIK